MLRGLLINDRLFFLHEGEGLVEKEERAKMVGCSPLSLSKSCLQEKSLTAGFYEIYI